MPNSRNMFYGCYRSNVKPGLINPGLFNWRHHIILWESSPQSKKPGFISPWNFRNWWDDGDVMGFFTSQQLIDVHIYIYINIYIQYYTDVCVHGGLHCRRKAGASKWTKSGLWAAPVCSFVVPKMVPKTGPKNGAAILPEEGKASKMAAPFLGPGCCIHSQPPSACSE